jgi:hypothetical protein
LLTLRNGDYVAIEHSGLLDLTAQQLAERIDWPPVE